MFSHHGIKETVEAVPLEPQVQSAQTTEVFGKIPLDYVALEPEARDNMQTEMSKEVSSKGLAQSLASVGPLGWLMEGFSSLSGVVTHTVL